MVISLEVGFQLFCNALPILVNQVYPIPVLYSVFLYHYVTYQNPFGKCRKGHYSQEIES